MKFITLGDRTYNTALISDTFSKETDSGTKYFVNFIGDRCMEITESEFNSIIDSNPIFSNGE